MISARKAQLNPPAVSKINDQRELQNSAVEYFMDVCNVVIMTTFDEYFFIVKL